MVFCTNKVVLNVAMTTLDPNWKHRGSGATKTVVLRTAGVKKIAAWGGCNAHLLRCMVKLH